MTRRFFLVLCAFMIWGGLPLKAQDAPGLEVVEVLPGTQAEAKLLKPGDVVLSYNGVALATFADLRQAVADAESAGLETLILRVRRRDKVYRITIKPGQIGLELAEIATNNEG